MINNSKKHESCQIFSLYILILGEYQETNYSAFHSFENNVGGEAHGIFHRLCRRLMFWRENYTADYYYFQTCNAFYCQLYFHSLEIAD